MKAAIVSLTWDSFGGGERYSAAIAQLLLKNGYQVDIWWPKDISREIKNRFGINVSGANFIPFPQHYQLSTINYQLVFWVSNGSIPTSWAKRPSSIFRSHFTIPKAQLCKTNLKPDFTHV